VKRAGIGLLAVLAVSLALVAPALLMFVFGIAIQIVILRPMIGEPI